jgi:predicted metalloprotease with PDZ domain
VTVTEGVVTRGIRITTSDATALDENGFALTTEGGALVVQDVTPGSPAADAGLEPGEEVVGVLLGGFDLSSAMGEDGAEFARAVLGHWDGPGVTLVVRGADGGEEEVPLEW